MKSNKNGVKIIAAIMVFALAFAGIVVSASDSDAGAAIYTKGDAKVDTSTIPDTPTEVKSYEELVGALKDGGNDVAAYVKLTANITVTAIIPVVKNLKVDLNGYTITSQAGNNTIFDMGSMKSDFSEYLASNAASNSGSTLTIVGSGSLVGSSSEANAVIDVFDKDVLYLESTVITSAGYGVYTALGATINSNNATITAAYSTISGNGTQSSVTMNITGGKYTSNTCASIFMPSTEKLTVNGGEFVGVAGFDIRAGTTEINDAVIKINAVNDGTTGTSGPIEWKMGIAIIDHSSYANGTNISVTVDNTTIQGATYDYYIGDLNRESDGSFKTSSLSTANWNLSHGISFTDGTVDYSNTNGAESQMRFSYTIPVADKTYTTEEITTILGNNTYVQIEKGTIDGPVSVPAGKTLSIGSAVTTSSNPTITLAEKSSLVFEDSSDITATVNVGSYPVTVDDVSGSFSLAYGSLKINGEIKTGSVSFDSAVDVLIEGTIAKDATVTLGSNVSSITLSGDLEVFGTLIVSDDIAIGTNTLVIGSQNINQNGTKISGSGKVIMDDVTYTAASALKTDVAVMLPAGKTLTFNGGNLVLSGTGDFTILGDLAGTATNTNITSGAAIKTTSANLQYVKQYASAAVAVDTITVSSVDGFIAAVQNGYKNIKLTLSNDMVLKDSVVKSLDLDGVNLEVYSSVSGKKLYIGGTAAGEQFSLNLNKTTITTKSDSANTIYPVSIEVNNKSYMDIVESNVFIEVIVNDGATVDTANNSATSDNITGDVMVGFGADLTLSGKVTTGLKVQVYGTLIIAEGKTLTVDTGAEIVTYSGSDIIVNGTLNNAGTITIASSAKLDVNGTMIVSNSYGAAVLENGGVTTIDGTLTLLAPNNGMPANEVKAGSGYNFIVNGTFTVNGKVSGEIKDKGTIAVNGTSSGASIRIYDDVSITITSVSGTLTITDDKIMMDDYANDAGNAYKSNVEVSEGNTISLTGVKGITVSEAVTSTVKDNVRYIWCDMSVSGNATLISTTGLENSVEDVIVFSGTPEVVGPSGSAKAGQIHVIDTLSLGKFIGIKVNASGSDKTTVCVDGSLVATAEKAKINNLGIITVNGSMTTSDKTTGLISGTVNATVYTITNTTDGSWIKTYANFEDAVAKISDADLKTIEVLGEVTASADAEIVSGQTVKISGTLTVGKDATVTIKDGAKIDGGISYIKVKGTLIAENYLADVKIKSITADVVSENGTARTYTSLAKALANAKAGDVITLSGAVTLSSDATIPEDVTVNSDYLITISKNKVLTINGTLNISKKSDGEGIKTGNYDGTDKAGKVIVNGIVSVVKDSEPAILSAVSGAHYSKSIGATTTQYVSNVAAAAAAVDENLDSGKITIIGTVTAGDLTFTKPEKLDALVIEVKDIAGDAKTSFSFDSITLVGAEFRTYDFDSTITGTVIGASNGADAKIDLKAANAVIIKQEVEETASGNVDHLSILAELVEGTVTISEGIVEVSTGVAVGGEKVLFTIAEGATLVVPEGAAIVAYTTGTNDKTASIIVNGTLDVKKGVVYVGYNNALGIIDVYGTMTVSESTDGVIIGTYGTLNVYGTVEVSEEENKEGKLTNNGVITVGEKTTTVGADAKITGPVKNTYGIVKVYSGSVDKILDGTDEMDPTSIYINGSLYMIVYGDANIRTVLNSEKFEIVGLDNPETIAEMNDVQLYTDAEMTDKITNPRIGQYDALYTEFDAAEVKGTVTIGTGVDVFIDGIKVTYGKDYPLDVGTHTIDFGVISGYDGKDVKITFNGQSVAKGGKIVITADMKDYVISVTGATPSEIVIPEPTPSEKDDGMGITEYLLIVLVVLAAILVVVVAIRMMRS